MAPRSYLDGKLCAVPNAVNSHGWWTNRRLLERNGLTVPVTWDDVYANAIKLKENDVYGMHNWQMCGDNLGMVLWAFWKGLQSVLFQSGRSCGKGEGVVPSPLIDDPDECSRAVDTDAGAMTGS